MKDKKWHKYPYEVPEDDDVGCNFLLKILFLSSVLVDEDSWELDEEENYHRWFWNEHRHVLEWKRL